MSNSQLKELQGFLFDEPSIAETGVWCSLNDGIDPAEWASLCRYIGNMGEREFEAVKKRVMGSSGSLESRLKGLFRFGQSNRMAGMPLVSLGPSGIGGEYQREG